MKHTLLGLSLLATCASSAYAQTPAAPATTPTTAPAKPAAPKPLVLPDAPKGTGRLSGTVLDGTTKKPVEFATVALLPATGDTPIDGTVADEKGRFSLRGLVPGTYRLQLSFLGYAALTRDVTVTGGNTDLGPLSLAASAQQLGDVTVTGEKETVEVKPDRIVYNADRDLTNKGGVAADVLRKVPLLNVDLDGNVQLRGSSNIKVLINNKPSSILAGNLADALKQLPADQIASVEVITTPGAKYDGEGTAGIVNIILKKNNLQGVNGSVNAAAGNRSSNAGGSLNVRRGKVGVNTNLSSYLYYSPSASNSERTNFGSSPDNVISRLNQNGSGDNIGGGAYGRMSLDYDPAKNHSLTVGFSGSLNRNHNENQQTNDLRVFSGPTASQLFTRAAENNYNSSSYDVNGTYTRTFEGQPRREWSLLAQHSRNRNLQPYALNQYQNQYTATGLPNYRESSDNLSRNLETTLQTDYTHPIGDKRSVEVGGKAILRQVLSDYQIQTATGTDAPFVVDKQRSNVFDYDQNVAAAYATYGFPLGKKLNSRVGTRLERTDIVGRFQQNDITRFTSGYTSLLPNASINYTRKPGSSIRLAYSRRIQRPNIYYLNPYENRVDKFNVSRGNPELDPEFTDSYELNYSTFVKGSVLNFSLFTRQTNNAIETVRTQRLDTTVSTFANVARNRTYGASVFGSFKPTTKWEISGSTSFNYVVLRSGFLNTTNEGLMYNFNLNSTYKFTKTLSAQFYGGISSSRVQLQGRSSAWNYYSMGIKKTILKEKGDLTLNADNFITARRDLNSYVSTPAFNLEQHNYIALRGIRLAFGYRFGKIEAAPPKQRRSIRNDDTKAGESQGGQQ
ncbi:TonB-dependent receptor domain-containing protein [Hymenobacter convexus]|uniref:TonB-dependent receptor domain-containing protein n=1 Tax=Hymenobacter sp. CA1UV-4 TaxID=3063782 RepID=UPI002712CC78|nr:TonB-dependent receptor [Hymenobacter sp. CA1UV-4]MDO7850000.1 TonB-dependent receptor [Hymenobacter sp. CA1UV-4]